LLLTRAYGVPKQWFVLTSAIGTRNGLDNQALMLAIGRRHAVLPPTR
jgi:hypothetical protein